MTQAEFPTGVRKLAVWCHLSGILWAMVQVAWNVISIPLSLLSSSLEFLGTAAAYPLFGAMAALTLVSFPFVSGFLTAFLFWKVNREKHPLIDECGKAATNFQASMGLYSVCTFLIFAFLVLVTCGPVLYSSNLGSSNGHELESLLIALGLAAILLGGAVAFAFWLFQVIVMSLAASRAAKGQVYVYPFSRQFFS